MGSWAIAEWAMASNPAARRRGFVDATATVVGPLVVCWPVVNVHFDDRHPAGLLRASLPIIPTWSDW